MSEERLVFLLSFQARPFFVAQEEHHQGEDPYPLAHTHTHADKHTYTHTRVYTHINAQTYVMNTHTPFKIFAVYFYTHSATLTNEEVHVCVTVFL